MRKIRYAVIGLGHIAQTAMLPAFKNSKNSELTALVSGDPVKLKKLGRKYGVNHLYNYEQIDQCLNLDLIDAVYIALPNNLHREYAEKAARAGLHVLCEKPMALNERDCTAMIEACADADVKLMIAYRLHFERTNMKAVEIVKSGKLGEPRIFNGSFTMQITDRENIRLQKKMGGGTLWDIGIYCLNAARYIFQDEPTEVMCMQARGKDKRFSEIDEMSSVILKFPKERLATFTSSFGAANSAYFDIIGTKGSLCADPAYEHAESLEMQVTIGERTKKHTFPKRDQFGAELTYFSDCIINDEDPEPSGYEGLADVRMIDALLKSAHLGRMIHIEPIPKKKQEKRPDLSQEIRKKPFGKTETVHVTAPHK